MWHHCVISRCRTFMLKPDNVPSVHESRKSAQALIECQQQQTEAAEQDDDRPTGDKSAEALEASILDYAKNLGIVTPGFESCWEGRHETISVSYVLQAYANHYRITCSQVQHFPKPALTPGMHWQHTNAATLLAHLQPLMSREQSRHQGDRA